MSKNFRIFITFFIFGFVTFQIIGCDLPTQPKEINELENQINKLDESYEKNKKLREEEYKKNWEIGYNQVLKRCKNE